MDRPRFDRGNNGSVDTRVGKLEGEILGFHRGISNTRKYVQRGLYGMAIGLIASAPSYVTTMLSDPEGQTNLVAKIFFCASVAVTFAGISTYILASTIIRHNRERIELRKKHIREIKGDRYKLN